MVRCLGWGGALEVVYFVTLRTTIYKNWRVARLCLDMAEPPVIVTLVHGTFAVDAKWVLDGSTLCNLLFKDAGANVVFRRFRWSGANTHAQRLNDAELLRRDLHTGLAEFPSGKHFILAHSHGGNLALYALRDRVLQSRISGVVTMGTPFLRCTEREVWLPASIMKWTLSIFGMFGMIVGWAILSGTPWAYSMEARLDAWNKGLSSLIFLASMVVDLALGLLLARLLWWLIDDHVLAWAMRRQASLMKRLNVREVGQVPLLCGSVTKDEASRWLASIRVAGNLGHTGFDAIASILRHGWLLFLLLTLLTIMQVSIPKFGGFFEDLFNGAGTVIEYCMVGAIALQIIMLFLPLLRAHRFGFGEGNVADNWLCDVSVAATPAGIPCKIFRLPLEDGTGLSGLRHSSFYESELFLRYVCAWIKSRSGG